MSKTDSGNAEERIAQILKEAQNAMSTKSQELANGNHLFNKHTHSPSPADHLSKNLSVSYYYSAYAICL